jgi:hypothetical protein
MGVPGPRNLNKGASSDSMLDSGNNWSGRFASIGTRHLWMLLSAVGSPTVPAAAQTTVLAAPGTSAATGTLCFISYAGRSCLVQSQKTTVQSADSPHDGSRLSVRTPQEFAGADGPVLEKVSQGALFLAGRPEWRCA